MPALTRLACDALRREQEAAVEQTKTGWQWGFKFSDGFYEESTCITEQEAVEQRAQFVAALRSSSPLLAESGPRNPQISGSPYSS